MVIEKGPDQHKCDMPGEDHNEEDDVSEEEYNALNSQLDQLNGWLDHLEQKNAEIQQQLRDLLHKSKTARDEFQKLLEEPRTNDSEEKPTQ